MESPPGYFVRLQQLEGYGDLLREVMGQSDYTKVYCLAHKGERTDPNPHWHLAITTTVKEKAFRKRMNAVFTKGKGNGHCSIKQWDGNIKAMSYMFHEEDDFGVPFINKGYSESDTEQFKKLNKDVKVLVEKAKQKAAWKLEEKVMDFYKLNPRDYYTEFDVGYKFWEIALENDMYPPNDWLLKSMVAKVIYKLSSNVDRHYFITEMVKKSLRIV